MIEHLNLARNRLESLPRSISNLSKLADIDLSGNNLTDNSVQQEEGQSEIEFAKSLKVINLSQNNFTRIPAFAYRIETVELKQNQITDWNLEPSTDYSLMKVRNLDVSGNAELE